MFAACRTALSQVNPFNQVDLVKGVSAVWTACENLALIHFQVADKARSNWFGFRKMMCRSLGLNLLLGNCDSFPGWVFHARSTVWTELSVLQDHDCATVFAGGSQPNDLYLLDTDNNRYYNEEIGEDSQADQKHEFPTVSFSSISAQVHDDKQHDNNCDDWESSDSETH